MSKFYSLTVKKICRETPNAVSVHFKLPRRLRDIFSYRAGQYLTIRKDFKGSEIRRAYSICTAPHSGKLAVTVKAVKGGLFSDYANTKLQPGDQLDVLPPNGRFVLTPDKRAQNQYVAFAAGSGITPVMSILRTVLEKERGSSFLLLYGNQGPQETIFLKELLSLQQKYKKRFFPEFVYSRTMGDNARFGRIDRSMVNYFLKNKYKHLHFHAYYLCGPEEMTVAVSETLQDNGVSHADIHTELFNAPLPLEVPQPSNDEAESDDRTALTVTLDGDTASFPMSRTKAVLDAVLDHGLDAPYSCQGGICSTCLARITKGGATMRNNQILTDGEIAEGLVLTCQAHPTTPELEIDYDDI